MSKVIVVSGDGHIGAPAEGYREYLEPQYRDRLDDVVKEEEDFCSTMGGTIKSRLSPEQLAAVDDEGAIEHDGELGMYEPDRRLAELDREGVAAEILHAGPHFAILPFFSVMNAPYPADLRGAGTRAYHRWAADFIAHAPGRFNGVADPGTCLDFGETRAELTWCAEHGFRAVSVPQQAWNDDLPPIHDPYYAPFWNICAELGLVLSVHAGWGSPQGKFQEFAKAFTELVVGMDTEKAGRLQMMEALDNSADSPLQLDMGPRRVMWQLMLSGAFDRHPDLKLALTEVRADWVPATLAHLDHLHATTDTTLTMKPTEYYARQCFVTPSSVHRCEVEMRYEIGVDQMLFGTDYPHPEGTWPNTKDWLRIAFPDVPEAETRAIVGENAIRAYGLDHDLLASVAERIGPDSSEVFGDFTLPEERVEHFNVRAGYSRGPEQPDTRVIDELFAEDLQGLAAIR
jgi:predicted TIM-barrel fold metal-dependent hydrolase